jgi:predicted Zn-dependent protease
MLKTARCEAALVCVLGHELAHLDRGHLLRRAKQLKLFEQRMKPSGEMTPERMLGSLGAMQQLFQRPFGPEEELEADRDGITWAYELGYDPLTINDLYAAIDKPAFAGGDFMPAFFRTHPPSAERRANLAETVNTLKEMDPKLVLYVGRQNLVRRIPKNERKFPE